MNVIKPSPYILVVNHELNQTMLGPGGENNKIQNVRIGTRLKQVEESLVQHNVSQRLGSELDVL